MLGDLHLVLHISTRRGGQAAHAKVFQMGRHRHGPRKHGPARQPACPCLARPTPVPVPRLPIRPMGQHGHGTVKRPGPLTARYPVNSQPSDPPLMDCGRWIQGNGAAAYISRPASPARPLTNPKSFNALRLSLRPSSPLWLSQSRPLRRRCRRATAPPKGDSDSPSSPRTPPPPPAAATLELRRCR